MRQYHCVYADFRVLFTCRRCLSRVRVVGVSRRGGMTETIYSETNAGL